MTKEVFFYCKRIFYNLFMLIHRLHSICLRVINLPLLQQYYHNNGVSADIIHITSVLTVQWFTSPLIMLSERTFTSLHLNRFLSPDLALFCIWLTKIKAMMRHRMMRAQWLQQPPNSYPLSLNTPQCDLSAYSVPLQLDQRYISNILDSSSHLPGTLIFGWWSVL